VFNSPDRIFEFFDNKVQIVPAIVSEEAGIEGQSNLWFIGFCIFKSEVVSMTLNKIQASVKLK